MGVRGIAGKGTNWVVSLANRLSIELSGGDVEVGGSLANLTITQPLLRGASRRIYLESLTQQERRLLYDARNLEQFRQGFFLDVVLGGQSIQESGLNLCNFHCFPSKYGGFWIFGFSAGVTKNPKPRGKCCEA